MSRNRWRTVARPQSQFANQEPRPELGKLRYIDIVTAEVTRRRSDPRYDEDLELRPKSHRPRKSIDAQEQIVLEWRKSGLSSTAFANGRDFTSASLYRWAAQLIERNK